MKLQKKIEIEKLNSIKLAKANALKLGQREIIIEKVKAKSMLKPQAHAIEIGKKVKENKIKINQILIIILLKYLKKTNQNI